MSTACDWLIFYGAQLPHIVSINNTYECLRNRDVARESISSKKFNQLLHYESS